MDDKKKDWLFRIFLTISLVWTAGVSWFLFKDQFLYNGYSPMPLNEIGDFLAGSFSPLAFFWLTYGYWMQSKELKYNRVSLEKQLDEFRESVAISGRNLSFQESVYKNNLDEKRRKVMPIFIDSVFEIIGEDKLLITMKNIGEGIKNVYSYNHNSKFSFSRLKEDNTIETWATLESKTLTVITESNLKSLSSRALSFTKGNFEHVTIAKEINIRFIGNDNSIWSVKASILGALHNHILTIDITFDEVNGHLNAQRVGEVI